MKLTTRLIIATLLCCVSLFGVAQSNKYIKANNNFGNTFNRLDADKTFHFPTGCGAPTLNTSELRKAAIWYDSCNAVLYVYNPAASAWDTAGSGAGSTIDTSSISNRINLKADKSLTLTINGVTYDLSANRSWTIVPTDTTSISNRINLKVDSVSIRLGDYVDTATYWKNGTEYDWYYIPVKNQLLGPSWVTYTGAGRTYQVHVPAYRIGSTFYPGIDTTITIDALSNPDSSRTDVFVATTTPNVTVKKSAESATPVAPQADQDEIYLTFVTLTPSNSGSGVDTIVVYRENVEWTGSASGVTVNFNGTTTPYQGSKVTDVGAVNGGDYIEYTYSTTVNRLTQSGISQFIKLKATVPNNNSISISFWNGTTQVSNSVNLPINKSSTSWQGISLGISDFTWTNSLFNKVRITYNGSGAGISGFLLDNIFLQSGISVPSAPTNYLQDIRRVGNIIEKQINNTWTVSFSVSDKADASTELFAGFGLLGGGTLAANRTFSVDSAGSIATKTYVQDRVAAVPTVVSYGKNAGGDSTILLLSNGQRFAARDSVGSGGGGSTPGGSNTHVQFNNGGAFAGSSNFRWDNSTNSLYVNGLIYGKDYNVAATTTPQLILRDAGSAATRGGIGMHTFLNTMQFYVPSTSGTHGFMFYGGGDYANDSPTHENSWMTIGKTGIGLNLPLNDTLFFMNSRQAVSATVRYYVGDMGSTSRAGTGYNTSTGTYEFFVPSSGTFVWGRGGEYGNLAFNSANTMMALSNSQLTVNVPITSTTTGASWNSVFKLYRSTTSAVTDDQIRFRDLGAGERIGAGVNTSNRSVGWYSPNSGAWYWMGGGDYGNDGTPASGGTNWMSLTANGLVINAKTLPSSSAFSVVSTTRGSQPSPTMTATQRNAISSPATMLQVSNTTNNTVDVYDGTRWNNTPNGLKGSAILDFGNTAAQTSADLTITVTGATDGDIVIVGPVNASTNANSNFTAWVSAANTVTVRFNNYSSGSIDPASGTFKVYVIKN